MTKKSNRPKAKSSAKTTAKATTNDVVTTEIASAPTTPQPRPSRAPKLSRSQIASERIEEEFKGVVDLLTRKAHIWDNSGDPMNFEIVDPPADMADKIEEYRHALVEAAVEQDEELMMAYLEGEEPSIDDIKRCIRKGTNELVFFPTYCGSAFKNKGI